MNALLNVILPVFLVIGFGYWARRSGLITDPAIDGVTRFAQNFALPCLLFYNMATLDIANSFEPGIFLAFYSGAFACFLVGGIAAYTLFKRPPEDSVAIGFCCLFSNSLLLGIPIMERAYGSDALAGNFTIIALHSPILYGAGIATMEIVRARGTGIAKIQLARQILQSLIRQPLVIGILLGLTWNLTGLGLPGVLEGGLQMMMRAALPAALFGLGGVLCRYRPEGDGKVVAMICVLSLIVHPLIGYGIGRAVGLGVDQLRSVVVTASMAPGMNAFLFANLYGVAKRVSATSVLVATALSLFSIWGWLHVLP
ncbi:AEC family transporter [Falsirhodobacter sp. 20TX0035]|uniref:AEC family transporter n=1 Tax=Falsirhodobacter sp. 20TX0035 TaxID=3022019 RepID=UPI00232B5673|nr:AEC family transporter [Falsirhodobacter sp. 20TX0035]MDB6453675.1 AEC family transporter [Falsirhodobacter sp. 20TX0035]